MEYLKSNMSRYVHTLETHNQKAAEIVLPLLFQFFNPISLLDVGCGIGTWLSVAKKLGVLDVKGVDADYVDRILLRKYFSEEDFISHDLTRPLELGRKFDLCLCLEVAEHLPENSGETLIDTLVCHSDMILFSAAIPGQGGQNHINEQEPQYWIEKFAKRGYNVFDPIRPLVWNNDSVDFWYRQNIFVFSKKSLGLNQPTFLYLVHPKLYQIQVKKIGQLERQLGKIKSGNVSFRFYLKGLIKSLFQ
ncbi:hypothetical protein Aoki45_33260 [Algoriphagus sp. oki45]|uniref:class I SAM-dependent methyltransferase n=1 Tax=Algoriphagus sp. oki45 TaxID=3067294 RepID=UPI0027F00488|nr:hypothetical protein Aoki45_33260 [Algoriphagus sp. oki45]